MACYNSGTGCQESVVGNGSQDITYARVDVLRVVYYSSSNHGFLTHCLNQEKALRKGLFSFMDQGWIKSYRSIMDNVFLRHDNNAFMVFVKLLHIVNKNGEWSGGRRQLSELMNINERTLYDVLSRLESQQMVNRLPNSRYTVIGICNWQKYQSSPTEVPTTAQPQPNHTPTTRQPQPNTLTRIKNKKENNNIDTKVSMAGQPKSGVAKIPSSDINGLFDYWAQTIGYPIQGRQKMNRYACSNLIKKHGVDGVKRLIQGVVAAKADRYAPNISDFTQLQAKYNDLISWGHRNQNTSNIEVIV